MCANRISTFLRSRRDCSKASVLASARATIAGVLDEDREVTLRTAAVVHLRLQRAGIAVALCGPDSEAIWPSIDVPVLVQLRAAWADVDVALLVEDEVGSAEGAIGACRLVPYRDVRCDLAIHQPLEQPDRAINGVACEPLRPKIEAALDALDHGLGDGNLRYAIGARALGVDDDPGLVVDEIVRVVGKEWVMFWPGNPCRLRIGQRDFFWRLASTAAAVA